MSKKGRAKRPTVLYLEPLEERLVLDDRSAGYAGVNSEFAGGSGPNRADLLTVMTHEVGHVLGFGSIDVAILDGSIMTLTLGLGERRDPAGFAQAVSAGGTPARDQALAEYVSERQHLI